MLISLHHRLTHLTGYRRNFAAFLLGICATLAQPPIFAFPLLIPAFAGLLWLIESAASKKGAFADGWWWGWGFYVTGLYWMCISMTVDLPKFGWMIPFALFGLPAVIAIYSGIAVLVHYLTRFRGWAGVWIFASIWTCMEVLRGVLFTGFPWNLAGYAWGFSDAVSQTVSVTGIYGLTWLTVLVASAPAALFQTSRIRGVLLIWLAFALISAGGAYRIHLADQKSEEARYVPHVMLRIVQPNIPQVPRWDPAHQAASLDKLLRLTASKDGHKITHVIWPESAVPYMLTGNKDLAQVLSYAAPPGGALITGGMRAQGEGKSLKLWNSVAAIDSDGAFAAMYDKRHLVPFGEYAPFRAYLPIDKITAGAVDFSEGDADPLINVPGAPAAAVLICYEAIFPTLALGGAERPGWLINVTNDAWFGSSSGPYQHFYMARMRAIEQGLPLVRAANTGISALIDPYGRIESTLPLNTHGVLDVRLPVPAHTTLYSSNKDGILLLLIIAGMLSGCFLNKRLRFPLK